MTELACKVSRRCCLQRGDCSRIQISMSNLIREATSNDAAGLASLIREAFADVARRFGLTPENGIDSARFYDHKGLTDMASQFIELRIEVMRRLAKT